MGITQQSVVAIVDCQVKEKI